MGAADYVTLMQHKLDSSIVFADCRLMQQLFPSITVCLLCLGAYERSLLLISQIAAAAAAVQHHTGRFAEAGCQM